jgi:dTDP-4-dehydrorhamnose reductase
MRVAITGTTGRVGRALADHFGKRHTVIELPRRVFDMARLDHMGMAMDRLECDVFLNPAGLTSLEACEDDPEMAAHLNEHAPGEISSWAGSRNVKVVHFSTDYVFAGNEPGLRTEEEPCEPLSVYGKSKRAGEMAVLRNPRSVVARVSWVFGPEKESFADGVIRSLREGKPVAAVADKFSLPTSTCDLAEAIEAIVERDVRGIIHVCQSGEPVSWHGMAEVVIDEWQALGRLKGTPELVATKLDEVAAFRAPRPRHSAMSTRRLESLIGRPMRPWEEALREYVRECR